MIKKKVLHIVGARPNFMKIAPVYESLKQYAFIEQFILHTGQHFDYNMSDVFFEQLGLPTPNYNIEVKGGGVLNQIGNGLIKLEQILVNNKPDLICIYGDINATAFASISAAHFGIKIAHIEAGLRSFDKQMPEEINRIIADSLTDYFFTPSIDANENLLREGKSSSKIFMVGNVMIDTLIKFLPKTKEVKFKFIIPEKFALITLHRPSNVDNKERLLALLDTLNDIGNKCKLIFPIHPRTKSVISYEELSKYNNIVFIDPLSYFEFISLQKNAKYIITDSGGVQEESTYLGVPCFTLRANTERPITIKEGTNVLVGTDIKSLRTKLEIFFNEKNKIAKIPPLWDGMTGQRIAEIIAQIFESEITP